MAAPLAQRLPGGSVAGQPDQVFAARRWGFAVVGCSVLAALITALRAAHQAVPIVQRQSRRLVLGQRHQRDLQSQRSRQRLVEPEQRCDAGFGVAVIVYAGV